MVAFSTGKLWIVLASRLAISKSTAHMYRHCIHVSKSPIVIAIKTGTVHMQDHRSLLNRGKNKRYARVSVSSTKLAALPAGCKIAGTRTQYTCEY